MLGKLLNSFLRKLPLDGYKTALGAVLLVVAVASAGLSDIVQVFPQAESLGRIQHYLVLVLDFVENYAEIIGVPTVYLGLIHKYIKFKQDSYF